MGIILARAGSKRLPGKNLKPLHGVPMVAYTIRAALACARLDRVIVSTDSREIWEVAKEYGSSPHPLRDASYAADHTTSLQTLRYELGRLEQCGETYDYVVLLQPTSPLRNSADIEAAIKVFEDEGSDTLTSVSRTPFHAGISEVVVKDDNGWKISSSLQGVEPQTEVFVENGAIFILSWRTLNDSVFYGTKISVYEIPAERNVDIDSIEDFELAEEILKRQAISQS